MFCKLDDDVPKGNLGILKDVSECSIAYEISEHYLSEVRKEKVIQGSNRPNRWRTRDKGSSSIQYHKNCYVTYTSNNHID